MKVMRSEPQIENTLIKSLPLLLMLPKLALNLSPGVSGAKFPGIRSHMQRAIGEVYSGMTEV
jgi:hypothetical protein